MSGPREGEAGTETIDHSYYDTVALAVATTQVRLFTVPLSGAKTLDRTNMVNAGQIPNGQTLDVRAIKIDYHAIEPRSTAELQLFYDALRYTTLSFKFTNKDFTGQWTLKELMGIPLTFNLVPTTAGDNVPMLMQGVRGVYPLNKPIIIEGQNAFYMDMIHHTAVNVGLAGDLVQVSLAGLLTRYQQGGM